MTEESWAEQHLGVIGASEAGNCLRAITYRLAGHEPAPFPARSKWAMERGKALEGVVAEMLLERGLQVIAPPVAEGYRIGAWLQVHPDRFISNGKAWVNCQIKVVNLRHFGYLRQGIKANSEHYWWQVQAEMAATALEDTLFVVCRADDMELHTEEVPFDAIAWGGRAALLEEAWEKGLLGELWEAQYSLPGFPCSYCSYMGECQPGAERVIVSAKEGEALVRDGEDPVTVVKDEYLGILAAEKELVGRKESLRAELQGYAEGRGVKKVIFYGLSGSLTPGRANLDMNAVRKMLSQEQMKGAMKEGQPYWTWRAMEKDDGNP